MLAERCRKVLEVEVARTIDAQLVEGPGTRGSVGH
jgi:hypothetical protein